MKKQAEITVFSRPHCVQCDSTYRALKKLGLDYQVVNLAEDAVARDTLAELGFSTVPVVVAGTESWAGFRPERIKALARQKIAS
ncbi:glutaredoxin-like protein NrdH [Gordonia alkaliphila]|uniref:glutaredoxin-like protein NrdH n=1 Tax=Gordonia alkaliphila TaxID=1053547 RepID=UPI001FF3EE56|nr:glutaredoxin-like protein NrdH [Gordonia alkaliphila]MCK0441115.1 glutaredoxin-like protein NrdH [Gordonia alkaliphila]